MAVVVVVVAVLGVGALVVSRSGGDDGGPAQAVRDFADAMNSRDCQGMLAASTDNLLNSYFDVPGVDVTSENFLESCNQFVRSSVWPTVTIEGTEVVSRDGNTAVVEVTEFSDGSSATHSATVKNVGGRWKLDSVTLDGAAASPGEVPDDSDAPGEATVEVPDDSDAPGEATPQAPGGSGGGTALDQSALDNCSLSSDDLGQLPPGDYETYIDHCGFPSD